MDHITRPMPPPRPAAAGGEHRRVGVEVEFAALTARDGARVVRDLFGGTIREEDPHRFHVEGTEFGTFVSELDTQYAHRPHGSEETAGADDVLAALRVELRRLFGDVSSVVMPCEIVCPPIPWPDLVHLDRMAGALNAAGATGTRASPFYAFGVQLNVEIAEAEPAWLAAILRAYLLASPWLRAAMSIDLTRRAVSFADPFPAGYAARVLAEDYAPDLPRLIDDYLDHNATRNRELDLLPLFAHLDPARLRPRIDDPRVKARPTFHYRLPDANLDRPDWSICLEWNRWVVVERLAADPALLAHMAADWRRAGPEAAPVRGRPDWPLRFSQWMILS